MTTQIVTAAALALIDVTGLNGGAFTSTIGLGAGTYKFTGAMSISAGVTLQLNGNCGENFVFIIGGLMSMGAGSRIVLSGGLSAASVSFEAVGFSMFVAFTLS